MKTSLNGLRVADCSQNSAGAYCSQLLAGYGADVVLFEPLSGHPLRHKGPFVGDSEDVEKSIPFLWYGQGKKSVKIDIESVEGRGKFKESLKDVDVLVESMDPGGLAELGIGYDDLIKINPDLIVVSITPFGQTGPYRHFKAEGITIEALSGQMFTTGSPDKPPLASGVPIAQMTAGLHGYLATLAACRLEGPRHIDVSIHEAGIENMELRAFPYWCAGKNPSRQDMAVPAVVPWKAYKCKDGWAAIHAAPFHRWTKFSKLFMGGSILRYFYGRGIEKLETSSTTGLGSLDSPNANRLKRLFLNHLDYRVSRWVAGKERREILEIAKNNDLAFGVLRSLPELLELPQHKARKFFHTLTHPDVGEQRYCAAPFPMNPAAWKTGAAPILGSDNVSLSTLWNGERFKRGGKSGMPLEGVRILDVTLVEAAPHGTRMLADLGAEVVKVEYPGRLDVFRGTALEDEAYDQQPFWKQLNRNKRSITLDLKSTAGAEAFKKLVAQSDVVVSNFRSRALEKLAIDYQSLKAVKSDIVLVSMSGYGDGGPDSDRPAYGGVIEVMSGVQNLTGYTADKPERIREIDILNGVAGSAAILTALSYRDQTGEGQYIDLSQTETTTHALLGESLLRFSVLGETPFPVGNRSSDKDTIQGCYPCCGDDCWLAISTKGDLEWKALCDLIGKSDWVDSERFKLSLGRYDNHDLIDQAITGWTLFRTPAEAMAELQEVGVAAGAVCNLKEVVEDPHLQEREWFFGSSDQPDSFFMGNAFTISGMEFGPPRPGPALGEANRDILAQFGTSFIDKPKREDIRSALSLD